MKEQKLTHQQLDDLMTQFLVKCADKQVFKLASKEVIDGYQLGVLDFKDFLTQHILEE